MKETLMVVSVLSSSRSTATDEQVRDRVRGALRDRIDTPTTVLELRLDAEQLRTTLDKIKRECNTFLSGGMSKNTPAFKFAQWVRWRVEQELREGWGEL